MSENRSRKARLARRKTSATSIDEMPSKQPVTVKYEPRTVVAILTAVTAVFVWSYWPTWKQLVNAWNTEPDYSHGFLVIPVAVWMLWARRESFPGNAIRPAIVGGLLLLLAALFARYLGARIYLDAMDGWSILLWAAGAIVAFAGWRFVWWCLPSLLMLWFMIPMPFRLEYMFRQPLQQLATKISCAMLVVLGEPAIAEGNTIRIGDAHFGVAEACSGLRIFVGIAALAFVFVVLARRTWWIKSLLLAAVLPVTLIANATRIVVTCWLQIHVSGETAHKFSHDIAGYVMIPFAAGLLGLALWYFGKLIREIPATSLRDFIQRADVPT